MTRHEKREQVLHLLFEADFNKDKTSEEIIRDACEIRGMRENAFIREVFLAAYSHIADVDPIIAKYAENWSVGRMSPAVRAILRLSAYEILYSDVPPKVSINEAVEFAKAYEDDSAPSFVNGILNRLARSEGKLSPDGNGTAHCESVGNASADSIK